MRFIISKGANIHEESVDGLEAIHYGLEVGNLEILEWFLTHYIDVHYRCNRGKSLILHACSTGPLKVVQWLVSENANLNNQTDHKTKPIHYACNFFISSLVCRRKN